MKRFILAVVLGSSAVSLVTSAALAQGKRQENQSRSVVGQVKTQDDAPVKDAVVYLKNLKTLAIKKLISDQQGKYSFLELSPNADYQVWAEANGQKSSPKTVSSFDSRPQFNIDLHLKTQ
jgi:predicted small secreted protein